ESTLQQVAVLNTTPDGHAGGIWGSGAAPVVDAAGNLYAPSGNGPFDAAFGGTNYGDSVLKFSTAHGLAVSDYFSPYNQFYLSPPDLDLGSSGLILLPTEPNPLLLAGGKEGSVYLLDPDNMGGFSLDSNSQAVQFLPHLVGKASTGQVGIWPMPCYWQNQVY